MENPILFDNNLNHQLSEKGYIVIQHDQFSLHDEMRNIYNKYCINNKGFDTTHFSNNKEYKDEVALLGKKVFQSTFYKLFKDYEVFFSNLMIKNPRTNQILPTHADWTYSDESKYPTFSIWIPSIDTDERNGAIGVIPYSHLLYEKVRGPEIVSSFRKFDQVLKDEKGEVLYLKKNEALIYDLRLLHFSLPNTTPQVRLAINITLKHKKAELIHYCNQNERIHFYNNLDEHFFMNYHSHTIPNNYIPNKILPIEQQISDKNIIEFYHLQTNERIGTLEKIKLLIKKCSIKAYNTLFESTFQE